MEASEEILTLCSPVTVTTCHMCPIYILINLNSFKLKNHFLSCANHVSCAQKLHVASGYLLAQNISIMVESWHGNTRFTGQPWESSSSRGT